eukprot:g7868.t1
MDRQRPREELRIWALSDVFFDQHGVPEWCKSLSSSFFRDDVLMLAGNVADSLPQLRFAMTVLKSKFRRIFYVPGNHDLWVRRVTLSSIIKGEQVKDERAPWLGVLCCAWEWESESPTSAPSIDRIGDLRPPWLGFSNGGPSGVGRSPCSSQFFSAVPSAESAESTTTPCRLVHMGAREQPGWICGKEMGGAVGATPLFDRNLQKTAQCDRRFLRAAQALLLVALTFYSRGHVGASSFLAPTATRRLSPATPSLVNSGCCRFAPHYQGVDWQDPKVREDFMAAGGTQLKRR